MEEEDSGQKRTVKDAESEAQLGRLRFKDGHRWFSRREEFRRTFRDCNTYFRVLVC